MSDKTVLHGPVLKKENTVCKMTICKVTVCKMTDDSLQEERVYFARYEYECNLQDDILQGTDIDIVCKSVKHSSLSLDDI